MFIDSIVILCILAEDSYVYHLNFLRFLILLKISDLLEIIEKIREISQVDDRHSSITNLCFLLL